MVKQLLKKGIMGADDILQAGTRKIGTAASSLGATARAAGSEALESIGKKAASKSAGSAVSNIASDVTESIAGAGARKARNISPVMKPEDWMGKRTWSDDLLEEMTGIGGRRSSKGRFPSSAPQSLKYSRPTQGPSASGSLNFRRPEGPSRKGPLEFVSDRKRSAENLSSAADAFTQNIFNHRHSIIGDSIKGAAIGGVAGGAINAAQGEDFWDGAGRGALVGGGIGGIRGAARVGLGGSMANQRLPGTGRRPRTSSLYQGFEAQHDLNKSFRTMSANAAQAREKVTRNRGRSNESAWQGW